MAGIEPASRELDHRYAPSLVGLLFLTRSALDRRSMKRARRSGTEAPALALRIAIGSAARVAACHPLHIYYTTFDLFVKLT